MKKNFNFKRCYTHAGSFHADDVFSTALVRLICRAMMIDNIPIYRVFNLDSTLEKDAIAYDIGGGMYDHHQDGAEVRENGVKYAAFGLMWRDFGWIVCPNDEAREVIDEYFIQPLDLSDNFGEENEVANIISSFNASWQETDYNVDYAFDEAVDIATKILERKIVQHTDIAVAHDYVEQAFQESDGEIVILDIFAPWKKVLVPSSAKFVVYPSNRGGYAAQVVPITLESNTAKCDFPKSWAGLRDKELSDVAGIDGLIFCHSALFYLAAETKEKAIEGCKKALKEARA